MRTRPAATDSARYAPMETVQRMHGVGPALARRLAAVGVVTLRDLLLLFPKRVRELVECAGPQPELIGRWVRLRATVQSTSLRWLPGRRSMVTVTLRSEDDTPFEVALFNQPYLKKAYGAGERRLVEGMLERRGRRWVLAQPRLLATQAQPEGAVQLRYPDVEGVSEPRLRGLLRQALLRTDLTAWRDVALPSPLRDLFPDVAQALRAMHQPKDLAEHERARRRFAVLEAVELFRRVEQARRRRLSRPGPDIALPRDVDAALASVLPFTWTNDQRAAITAIGARLRAPSPMGVLLQGDVGTGKTAVALWAALAVVRAGGQVAFLAPTELLAEQHHAVLAPWLSRLGVTVHLLTASLPTAERRALDASLREGSVPLVVGTHALLSETTEFDRLALVVIDEQHRFGVEQRMQLVRKGRDPHVLVMTATPIPRTLTLSLFGDLDLVELRQRPAGRPAVRARYLRPERWPRMKKAIARRIARGERVFVVCPQIGENGEKGGAVRVHGQLATRFACGLVHGRMTAAERQSVVDAFRCGEITVLVGTTVLEVGVDVPDATLMIVIGADRFGLSTLHQLRGRVGRGRRRGLCLLTGERTARVDAVCRTTDGFALAETDLALRGAGELLGRRQSGVADLRALDPIEDLDLLQQVREAVRGE